MQQYSVFTNEYDADIGKLLSRRLAGRESGIELTKSSDYSVTVSVSSEAALDALSAAVCELMLEDLRYFEIAAMVNRLPFSLDEKRRILPAAVRIEDSSETASENSARAVEELREYFSDNFRLNLEGYIRFRLPGEVEKWSVMVDAAAEELLLGEECADLIHLLGLFTTVEPPRTGGVAVLLNPDGSCTITDADSAHCSLASPHFRIDCAPNSNEGVISILTGLSPSAITLYDFSFGRSEKLRAAIETLFAPRLDQDE